jgi:NEDD8-activating enzyme E1
MSMLIFFCLPQFIKQLEKHPDVLMSKASVTHQGNNLYMQAPPILEEMTRCNLSLTLYDLLGKVARDTVHVSGMTEKNGKRSSALRKLRVSFKGVSAAPADMDIR